MWVEEMAKAFAAKPNNLTSIPQTTWLKEKEQTPTSFSLAHILSHKQINTCEFFFFFKITISLLCGLEFLIPLISPKRLKSRCQPASLLANPSWENILPDRLTAGREWFHGVAELRSLLLMALSWDVLLWWWLIVIANLTGPRIS